MSASVNLCVFIGNVGKIETRYMSNGEAVTNISLACNETWKSKDGEKHEKCEWVNAVMYRKLAEVAEKYIKVGSQIFISGKMQTDKYEKDGITRYTTKIIVNEMKMLGGKSEQSETATEKEPVKKDYGKDRFDNFSDDIPF
jgi:single-strand DNA-binding protein